MSELTAINVQDFKKRVQDHVLNTFGSLIPEDQFQKLVDAEIKSFFEGVIPMEITQVESHGYGGRRESLKTSLTPFRAVVYATLLKMIGPRLDEFFNSEHAPVKKMLDELVSMPETQDMQFSIAQKMMMAMAGTMFQNVMNAANGSATSSVANALRSRGLYDVANEIRQMGIFHAPEVGPNV